MKYGSVCSGIEAATTAWHPLGWKPSFFSEIEKFPRDVLQHHFPDVPLHGDFTTIQDGDYDPIELLVGGTPCQSFSVAGLRKGLSDDRGNLTLEFIRLAQRLRPRWLVWENVPGVLSIDKGRAFGSFLGGLAECGYGFAYRVLDAQYFGVPQRRRRVFIVGYFGDWRPAAQVLFEREGLQRDITPRRETREDPAGTLGARSCRSVGAQDADAGHLIANTLKGEGFDASEDGTGRTNLVFSSTGDTAHCLNAGGMGRQDYETETMIAIQGSMIGRSDAAGPNGADFDESGTCFTLTKTDIHAVAFHPTQDPISSEDVTHALGCGSTGGQASIAVAFAQNQIGEVREGDVFNTLNQNSNASGRNTPLVAFAQNSRDELREMNVVGALAANAGMKQTSYIRNEMQVRRLTPVECERLQGFPDGYTKISPKTADGPRYKALGNSMAVPVMRWIGERIQEVDNAAS